ncbi:glycosyltransferase [Aetokthonos hydrillicola Thurmond2011]|jgi:glycosyltransferase involved in cell wall biosynthesis|uniref:Glycosyltransferase n=1 Tax=Aetokthonos hydrillicola Thurmond2011 TaxID=2712845 RepID=A0AAP5ICS7_9CYAN|nr:glycosyltransferase [Aetokthonos hydrillicola]MBO3461928.1 glycosyltransferase [Aetokthonos hydrillicola CCALA 1050]MBW4585407.1 glycosyltransferase [Aetokthonos hydrillicola CCALA 1050]MDR9899086.1 glycosyltransferase [Aetokthonos hydrillicola Thurmond2011]
MKDKYIYYTDRITLQPDTAHEIHDVLCANAAANLGYSSVLVYPDKGNNALNPVRWFFPFQPRQPDAEFKEFYNAQKKLKVAPLPMPWPIDRIQGKLTNSSTIATKYYLPLHLRRHTKVVHTRDWNFVKASIKHQIPVIYERHYFQELLFEPEIVNSPFFQIAITQSEPVRQSLIKCGMPSEKVVWIYNGFEQSFLVRQPEAAQQWRKELLTEKYKHLIVYSGALYPFKGIDLLIDVAKQLPEILFAVTGGKDSQVQAYQQLAKDNQVENIKFLGWILPRERLVSLLQAADILAHPHLSGTAADITNPVKFFQYMAAGAPIAVTEIPPLMVFKDSPLIAGWCEPDNPYKFAECIEYVLKTYPRKTEGYTESINFARQFSWEERTKKIISYLDVSFRPPIVN